MRGFSVLVMFVAGVSAALAGSREVRLHAKADRQLALMGIESPSAMMAETEHYAVYGTRQGGFVVMAKGDDGQVLAYSSTAYSPDSLPCGLRWWLSATDEALSITGTDTPLENPVIHRAASNYAAVPDFLETKWGQDAPYNASCPLVGNMHPKTGCMATAMAQVLRYYHWPEHGVGQGGYYLGSWTAAYFHSEAVDAYYDWNNTDYQKLSGAPEAAKAAVAALMFDCGKACRTCYTAYGSSAYEKDQLQAMAKHFQYDSQTMRFCEREQYSASQWLQMVYDEIQNRRPIFYSGYLENGKNGHAFLLCGMDDEGKVYVNWGQDGRYDGFFSIDALVMAGYDLTHAQTMIIGVQPQTPTTAVPTPAPTSAGQDAVFTLDGMRVRELRLGINIVRQGTQVRKVIR